MRYLIILAMVFGFSIQVSNAGTISISFADEVREKEIQVFLAAKEKDQVVGKKLERMGVAGVDGYTGFSAVKYYANFNAVDLEGVQMPDDPNNTEGFVDWQVDYIKSSKENYEECLKENYEEYWRLALSVAENETRDLGDLEKYVKVFREIGMRHMSLKKSLIHYYLGQYSILDYQKGRKSSPPIRKSIDEMVKIVINSQVLKEEGVDGERIESMLIQGDRICDHIFKILSQM